MARCVYTSEEGVVVEEIEDFDVNEADARFIRKGFVFEAPWGTEPENADLKHGDEVPGHSDYRILAVRQVQKGQTTRVRFQVLGSRKRLQTEEG